MKTIQGFIAIALAVIILCACTNRIEKIISKYELQNVDTIYIASVPGYTYDIIFKKSDAEDETEGESEDQEEKPTPVLVTSSGKIVFVQLDRNLPIRYDAFEQDFSIDLPPKDEPEEVDIPPFLMDTSHVWVNYKGEDEPVDYDCDVDELVEIPCGDEIWIIPCPSYGIVIDCDEAAPENP